MKIIWLSRAIKSMDEIYDFFALKNVHAANLIYNKILERVETLSSFPELGKPEPELSKDSVRNYRSLIILKGDYKVIYFIENHIIHISYIWVCSKQPQYLIQNIQEMEKEYNFPEESKIGPSQNPESGMVNEPAIEYGLETEMTYSPPLTEEEEKELITGEELMEDITQYIHELFAGKK